MTKWIVLTGRFGIRFVVTFLNRLFAAPWEYHIKRLVNIFGYLQDTTRRRNIIVISPEDIREISGKGSNTEDWLDNYPDTTEEIYEGLPEMKGNPLINMLQFDSDHSHDQVTWQLVSGVMCFVGSHL